MTKSHLYPGFKYVGALSSIIAQRELQSTLMNQYDTEKLVNGSFLSVGTGYGDELAFFAVKGALDCWNLIYGIDIVGAVGHDVLCQSSLSRFSERVAFQQLDLQQLPSPFGENHWDCIQCGFVLEDIEYQRKQDVFDRLYRSLKEEGILLISEMFVDNRKRDNGTEDLRKQQIADLYDRFLLEACDSFNSGSLTQEEYNQLCGDGVKAGLYSTKAISMEGERDFFETRAQTEDHLRMAGFQKIVYHPNPVNPFLGVITALKYTSSGRE